MENISQILVIKFNIDEGNESYYVKMPISEVDNNDYDIDLIVLDEKAKFEEETNFTIIREKHYVRDYDELEDEDMNLEGIEE